MAVTDIVDDDGVVRVTISPVTAIGTCPGCGTGSGRIHSRYHRRLADLPATGRPVGIVLLASRFFCDAVLCGRRVFTERFDPKVLAPWARRTARLGQIRFDAGRPAGGDPCPAVDAAGEQRHLAACGAPPG
ncbi:transposase family protein [Niveispirillum irakense]|uniref:transposase family protein n=1 Tax=Niveispirillum irakense TaxID=34011 RepID=UPI003CCBB540